MNFSNRFARLVRNSLFVLLLLTLGAAADQATAKLKVAGMSCETGCVPHVRELLGRLPGVVEVVEVKLAGLTATVRFDDRITSPDQIARGLEEASARRYLARPLPPGDPPG
ncbi:MAG: heavy-metal-associated domain-containing protein [Vulcanimicrobiota bacterium]